MQVATDKLDKFFNISTIVIGIGTIVATVCMCVSVYNSSISGWIKTLLIMISPVIWLVTFYATCLVFALVLICIASMIDRSIWKSYFGGDIL